MKPMDSSGVMHVMIDIETTGLDPNHTNIIQIGALTFTLDHTCRWPASQTFNRCLRPLPDRFYSAETDRFWKDHPETRKKIEARMEDPRDVMEDFRRFILLAACGRHVFAWFKPATFDYPFIESYFKKFGIESPFHYRNIMDTRSFIRARLGTFDPTLVSEFERSIMFEGQAHDALADATHQMLCVLKAFHETGEAAVEGV